MDAPIIEIFYTQQQTDQSSSEPTKRKKSLSTETILEKPTGKSSPPSTPSTPSAVSSGSSSDDPLGSFRGVSNLADSIINQSLEQEIEKIKTKFREVQSLFEETKKDHLDVLQRILQFHAEKKELLAFNGTIKKDISSHSELIQQLKDRVEMTEINCQSFNTHLETISSTKTILQAQQAKESNESSEQFVETSENLLKIVKASSATESLLTRIEEIEKQYQELAKKQAEKISVDNIIRTPQSPKRAVLAIDEETSLETILTQFQKELESLKKLRELEKQVTELLTVKKDIQKITDTAATEKEISTKKIVGLENDNASLRAEFQSLTTQVRRWAFFGLTSFAACFWILWHVHKK